MTVPNRLAGKIALVTGAARGQGRAHAVRLASEGADVIAVDVCASAATTHYDGPTRAELDESRRWSRRSTGASSPGVADVRDLDALGAAVDDGVGEPGGLDVVVANAGICSGGNVWELTSEQWQETLDVNLTGVFHTMKATVPILIEQGSGWVVRHHELGRRSARPAVPRAYAASKHGVVGLARTMANELALLSTSGSTRSTRTGSRPV